MRHALPPRPNFDSFETNAAALGFGPVSPTTSSTGNQAAAISGITGSAHDWVANRRAIRMANMSAAEMLKAEMMAATPMSKPSPPPAVISPPAASPVAEFVPASSDAESRISDMPPTAHDGVELSESSADVSIVTTTVETEPSSPHGTKRKFDELDKDAEGDDVVEETFEIDPEEDEDTTGDTSVAPATRKVNPDGTVDQEDTVKYVLGFLDHSRSSY